MVGARGWERGQSREGVEHPAWWKKKSLSLLALAQKFCSLLPVGNRQRRLLIILNLIPKTYSNAVVSIVASQQEDLRF